ncbi:uncharacterized protein IL334_006709 [Kwoniella shivajii]|uniref:Uncharacterized protein n=1 Tax=Kwoniella shivajii TaxID=564305 RepID=A0ABZ1D8D5_9TREE|nr:hypothetical protein IL334_006709 [Kwoniella shivajii]
MASYESTSSLLIPPNPSLSPTKPSASILLNGTGRALTTVKISSPPRITTPLPQSPPLTSFPLPSSSASSSRSASFSSTSSPHPPYLTSRRLSTPKISFAPLPTIPNELKRRNSISIGVASRKNLLAGGGGGSGGSGVNKVVMTDEDWENYKRKFDEKSGNDPIDLGAVAKQGAKALWGKVKRSRSISPSPGSSVSSTASSSSRTSPSIIPSGFVLAASDSMTSLDTVEEDEEQYEPLRVGRRSPPPSHKLRTIPGSPPPTDKSMEIDSSPSTITSTISDSGSEMGDQEDTSEVNLMPSYTPGNRVAASEASSTVKNRLLDLAGNQEDGDATPRRRPSPPPRRADIEPLEEEEGDGGTRTPGRLSRASQWEKEHHDKKDRIEILGFDPERFGRALDLASKNGEVERA